MPDRFSILLSHSFFRINFYPLLPFSLFYFSKWAAKTLTRIGHFVQRFPFHLGVLDQGLHILVGLQIFFSLSIPSASGKLQGLGRFWVEAVQQSLESLSNQ